jgi:tungstate transport system substrate-binding protein
MLEHDRYKLLLEADGTDRFQRLGAILAAVAQHGSLNRATAALGISYRQAWGLLRKAEERLGLPLLTRRVGGAEGGGAELTEAARDLLVRYQRLQHEVAHILSTPAPDPGRPILIASTIGPVEVGLMDLLEAAFHRATRLWVRHIAAGSGQALAIAREGRVDVVLAHAPADEERFIQEGWGARRCPLMENRFLICGPASDPAGVGAAASAVDAFVRIATVGAPFLSRGDQSGTHQKELALWASAGVMPGGAGYRRYERGAQGSGVTLQEAQRTGAYMLVDRATYAATAPARLAVLLDQDDALVNPFSLIALNPQRLPQVNHSGAERFIEWATGPDGQAIIAATGHFAPVNK